MSCLPRRAFQREKLECPIGIEEESMRDCKSRRRVLDIWRVSPSQQSINSLSNSSDLGDLVNFASIRGCRMRRTNSGTLTGLLTPSAKKTSDSERDTVSQKQIEVYGQVFEDIIRQDTVYGGLLQSVKKNYDDFIAQLIQFNSNLQEQVSATRNNTHQEVLKEFQKLKDDIDHKNKSILKLRKEKEHALETLKAEKENAQNTISKLTCECKSARVRENKYLKLVNTLRDKGYPVEEVYKKHIRKKPTPSASVPKICLPSHSSVGFHQEFMANYEEFSDSWREQIQKQNQLADNL